MPRPPQKREDPITAPRCPACERLLDRDGILTEGKRLLICRTRLDIIRQGERQRCGQRIYIVATGRIATIHPISKERFDWVLEFARRHGHGPDDPMDDPIRPPPIDRAA